MFTTWFRDEAGASPSWLFVAPTDKTRSRKAIVKVACIPVGKHAAQKHHTCMPEVAAKYAKIYLAIEKVVEDCGLTGAAVRRRGGPVELLHGAWSMAHGACGCSGWAASCEGSRGCIE